MAEYIEREAAKLAVCERCDYCGSYYCKECENPADAIPAADVRPVVRGKWLPHSKVESPVYHCSVCGGAALHAFGKQCKSCFCPNCGAQMRDLIND